MKAVTAVAAPLIDACGRNSGALQGGDAPRHSGRFSRRHCNARRRCNSRRGVAALCFLGRTPSLLVLACDLFEHDLQPFAELRHGLQVPGAGRVGACAVVGSRSSSSCLALLPSVPVSSVPSQFAPAGIRFSTFGAAASTASILLSAPVIGTGMPRGAWVMAATLCQSI